MPENFDTVHVEDRAFILAGEEFRWRLLWWQEFGEWIDTMSAREQEEADKQKDREERAKTIATETGRDVDEIILELETDEERSTILESFQRVIDRIVTYLEPDDVERFKQTVENPEKRVTMLQLNTLRDWLQEVQNRRPPEQPSSSADGPGTTEATLKAA